MLDQFRRKKKKGLWLINVPHVEQQRTNQPYPPLLWHIEKFMSSDCVLLEPLRCCQGQLKEVLLGWVVQELCREEKEIKFRE